MSAVDRPTEPGCVAYVCRGGDCRKRSAPHAALLAALGEVADVRLVRCQDLCHGPVAAVEVGGRLEWFERLRGRKARAALVEVATGRRRRLPGRLRERRARKRSGRPPRGRPRPARG